MALSILIARFGPGEELLQRFLPEFPHGGLFQPTRTALEVGAAVLLDVRMSQLKDGMLLRGTVSWRQRGKRGSSQRAGLGIAFSKGERGKVAHLLALAEGKAPASEAQRRHRRLPVSIAVQWRVPNQIQSHESLLEDIGAGGAFIRTSEPLAEGGSLVLDLSSPGRPGVQSIAGRVAWTSSRKGSEGAGVEFRCRDLGGMRRIKELVRRIEASQTEA